ncbi:MAG: DUF3857 domain-containing protein [Bacteroidota bacterium]
MKYLIATLLVTGITCYSFSQRADLKFGKVSKDELTLKECDFYPDADAMVLGDKGVLKFMYHSDKGWQYGIEITRRIKIFNVQGKEHATVRLNFYDPVSGSSKEEISQIKAMTYNLVGGKIEKTKLEGSEKFETRISDYRTEIGFSMPNVQEGSVIEYKYTLTSDFTSNLYEWHFQEEIPVKMSQFTYTIPEFFRYQTHQVGSYVATESSEHSTTENFTYTYETVSSGNTLPDRRTASITSNSKKYVRTATNVRPLIEEPFMNNKPNLPSRIESQLITINMPNQPIKNVSTNYEAFNKTIMESSSFGKVLNKSGFAKEKIATLSGTETEKAASIYTWIRDHFNFNGVNAFTSEEAGKRAFSKGEGSAAAINLTLIAALRGAGFDANPVLLGTRGFGIPHPIFPNYEDFNYVIVHVKTNDGTYFADATGSMPFGKLPMKCLNGNGWLASENGGRWVDLKQGAEYSVTVQAAISFDEGAETDNTKVGFKGYAAIQQANRFNSKGESEYEEGVLELFGTDNEVDFTVENNPDDVKWTIDVIKDVDDDGVIYVNPIPYGAITTNPFKREERYTNIDFPYLTVRRVIVSIEVPEGYKAELPESSRIKLPEDAGVFTYYAAQQENEMKIMSTFRLKKTVFTPNEYAYLKAFYQQVAEKNSELIVLKKI